MQTIEVRGVEYKLVKARDFEVIVRSDNGFINYTKLCQQINDGKKPFYNIKANETFKRLCIQMEETTTGIPVVAPEIEIYEQIKDRIEIIEGGDKNVSPNASLFFKETLLCQLVLWNLLRKHLKLPRMFHSRS